MIAFIEKLNSEVLRSIERIESRDTDVLKKSLEASRVLGEAFDRLKQYIIGYRFQNDDEEIKFFKEMLIWLLVIAFLPLTLKKINAHFTIWETLSSVNQSTFYLKAKSRIL